MKIHPTWNDLISSYLDNWDEDDEIQDEPNIDHIIDDNRRWNNVRAFDGSFHRSF